MLFGNVCGTFCCSFILAENDPMEIIKKNNTLGSKSDTTSFPYLFDFQGIFNLLKQNAVLIGAIVILALLITMFFIHDPKAVSEKKKDIEHKLFIIFLVVSSVWIFNLLKTFFNAFI